MEKIIIRAIWGEDMLRLDLRERIPDFNEYCDLYNKTKKENGLRDMLTEEIYFYEKIYGIKGEEFIELYAIGDISESHDLNTFAMKYELWRKLKG